MIAVDTNILVYAHRADSPWHAAARRCLDVVGLAPDAWCIPWPCIHEFLGVVTNVRIYSPSTPVARALEQVAAWLEAPNLVIIAESDGYWPVLRSTLEGAGVSGPRVHDARVAAICRFHGVTEIWTADRDFGRFPGVAVRNPLVANP